MPNTWVWNLAGPGSSTIALVSAAFDAATSNAGLSPLDFLLGVMRDSSLSPDLRMKAAQAAAPYVHAKPGGPPTTDLAASAKRIEGACEDEARARGRMLELSLAKWRKEISSAETEELESLQKAYPPDPEDPLKASLEAWRRAAADAP
jgi:uncharacterized protein (DUF1684 family)